jgi:large subunit ribosomal protein L15
MRLNSIKPAVGATRNKKRVGRGIGSGTGKTCGRGHKGQKSRAGGFHKIGFEGGQMPLHRRLPKRGFKSMKSLFTQQIRLGDIDRLGISTVNLSELKKCGLVSSLTRNVKVFLSGSIKKPVKVENIKVSRGVKVAIEKAGGSIENTKEIEKESK